MCIKRIKISAPNAYLITPRPNQNYIHITICQ